MTSGEAGEPGRASSRSALIAAALDEVAEKLREAATVAGIAERAGVTTGALYAHFDGKLDVLLETIGMKTVDTFVRTINEAAAGLPAARLRHAASVDRASVSARASSPAFESRCSDRGAAMAGTETLRDLLGSDSSRCDSAKKA